LHGRCGGIFEEYGGSKMVDGSQRLMEEGKRFYRRPKVLATTVLLIILLLLLLMMVLMTCSSADQ
jgi:hypothetical protein